MMRSEGRPLRAQREPSRTGPGLLALCAFLAAIAVQTCLLRPIVADYQPTGDEIALIGASTDFGGPAEAGEWLSRGFTDYFKSYPEWRQGSTEFARPAANAIYWLLYRVFGAQWTIQLLLGYLIHAVVVGLITWFASARLGLGAGASLLVAACALVNPAYWSRNDNPYSIPLAIQFPIFQTELMATLLAVLGLLASLGRRFGWFAVLLSVGVLLKETALTAPVSALLLVGIWRGESRGESLRNAGLIAFPLLLWAALKLGLLQSGTEAYPLQVEGPLQYFRHLLRGLLFWPSGLFDDGLGEIPRALQAGQIVRSASLLVRFALNLAWLGSLAFVIHSSLWKRAGTEGREPADAALVFGLGNLALIALLPVTNLRYGYLWFSLAPAALLALLRGQPAAYRGMLALVALLTLLQLPGIATSFSTDSLDSYRALKQSARALVARLGALPAETQVAYVVDDLANKHTSARYLAKFAGFHGEVVLVLGALPMTGCHAVAAPFAERYQLYGSGADMQLQYRRSSCLAIVDFIPHELLAPDHSVARGDRMRYRFPQLGVDSGGGDPQRATLGDEAEITVSDPRCAELGGCVWLGYDVERRDYRQIHTILASPRDAAGVNSLMP